MNVRRAAPFAFAALCVALSGFVLRGQIAARPLPPSVPAPDGPPGDSGPSLPSGPL